MAINPISSNLPPLGSTTPAGAPKAVLSGIIVAEHQPVMDITPEPLRVPERDAAGKHLPARPADGEAIVEFARLHAQI